MYVISGRPRRHIRPRTVRQALRGRDEASRKIRRGPRYVPRRLTAGTPHLGPSPPRAGATLAPPLRPVPASRARCRGERPHRASRHLARARRWRRPCGQSRRFAPAPRPTPATPLARRPPSTSAITRPRGQRAASARQPLPANPTHTSDRAPVILPRTAWTRTALGNGSNKGEVRDVGHQISPVSRFL